MQAFSVSAPSSVMSGRLGGNRSLENSHRFGDASSVSRSLPLYGSTTNGRRRQVDDGDGDGRRGGRGGGGQRESDSDRSVAVQDGIHTPSIAFRHLPPNSARFSYATEGALFISAQMSTDAVSALRKLWVLIRLSKQHSVQAPT